MRRRTRRKIVSILRYVLVALALLGLVAAYAPLLDVRFWWIRVLSFPRVQFAATLGLILVLFLLLPKRRSALSLAGVAACLIGIAGQLAIIWPYMSWTSIEAGAAGTCEPANRLRIAAINVKMTNEDANGLLRDLRAADPDLIFFQETDEWWVRALASLADAYPYRVSQPMPNYYGLELVSRYPLIDPEIHWLTHSLNPSVFTGVRLPSGAVARFYGLHPRPPAPGQVVERNGQIMAAALAIREDDAPSVLAGDMNATPWSRVIRRASRVGGLLDPRKGRGWTPTFSTRSLVLTWPLDHVLIDESFLVSEFRALSEWTSDHRPIYADLCLEPAAAARQSPPPLKPDDLEEAREAVIEGQGEARATEGAPLKKQLPALDD